MSSGSMPSAVITLNEEQWADFIYNMTHPKPPTSGMIAAAKLMLELSQSPGDREYESWFYPQSLRD